MSLTDRAMLVNLTVRQWSARKYDKKESADVQAKHGLTVDVARVNKSLLPLAPSLQRLQQQTNTVRKGFLLRTLPWGSGDQHILKADAYFAFTKAMNPLIDEWHACRKAFLGEYPVLQQEARRLLNGMYNDADYPSPHEISRRFDIELFFAPLPDASDWRIQIGDEEAARLKAKLTQQIAGAQAKAMADAWERLFDVVSKAEERLRQPDAIFRDTLVSNAVELCSLLPGLNLTDDPQLEKMRQEVEGKLAKFHPDALRQDPVLRKDTADAMADLMARMAPMYGRAA